MASYITPDELAVLLRSEADSLQVVDCRDEDFAGGHIKDCINVTTEVFHEEEEVDELVDKLAGKKRVVFHCMLSQQRGPFCAARFTAALSRSDLPRESKPQVFVLQGGWKAWSAKYGSTALSES